MTSPSLDRAVESRLRDDQVRYTTGRRAVVAALERAGGPLSAAELHERVDLPLSSLYRSLAVLEQAGVVEPHTAVRGVTRYELGEWLRGHHHHLICLSCGAVEDVAIPETDEVRVQELVVAIGELAAFRASGHALEIEGLCARCS